MAKTLKGTNNSFAKTILVNIGRFLYSLPFIRLLPYILIFIVCILSCFPLFSGSTPIGDDLLFHAYRYKGTFDALLDGQFIPQVDPQALYGFGHSWNIFYGPLVTYIAALLHIFPLSWPAIINIIIIVSVLLSGIFMYRYLHEVSKNSFIATIAAVLYTTAPYHLFDIYSRQAGGEILSFIFIPLVFHGLWRIINSGRRNGTLFLIIGAVGLLLTHNLSAVLVAGFSTIYLLCNIVTIKKSWKKILPQLIISCVTIVGLSSFFLIPLLEAKHLGIYNIFDPSYTSQAMGINGQYLNSWRIDYLNYIFNPTTINSYSDTKPFALGALTITALILLLFSYRQIPKDKKYFVLIFMVFSLFTLILSSRFVNWLHVPHALLTIQFPWRFLFVAIFFISIVSAYSLYYSADIILGAFKKIDARRRSYILISTVVLIAITSIFISINLIPNVNNKNQWTGTYSYESTNGLGGGEYLPATSAIDDKKEIEQRIQTYLNEHGRVAIPNSSAALVSGYKENGSKTQFNIVSTTESNQYITLPYIYYPGYKAEYINAKGQHKKLPTGPSAEGFLKIYINGPIDGKIISKYGLSNGTIIGCLISFTTIFSYILYLLKRKTIRHNNAK